MVRRGPLHIVPAYEGRDPIVMGAVWIGTDLPPVFQVVAPIEPDDFTQQSNQHVMDYWTWRLNQLALRTLGRK